MLIEAPYLCLHALQHGSAACGVELYEVSSILHSTKCLWTVILCCRELCFSAVERCDLCRRDALVSRAGAVFALCRQLLVDDLLTRASSRGDMTLHEKNATCMPGLHHMCMHH